MIFKYDENGFDVNKIFKDKQLSPTSNIGDSQAAIDLFNESKLSADAFSEAIGGIDDAMLSYLRTCKNGEAYMDGFDKHVIKTNKSIGLTGVKSKIAAVGVGILNTALSAGISLLAGFVIGGVINFFDDIINKNKKIAEAAQEAREEIESLSSTFQTNRKFVTDNSKRYAELAQGVDQFTGKNLNLSTEEYNEFLSLSSELAKLFPSLSRTYTENGDAIVDLKGDVDGIVGSIENLIESSRETTNIKILENAPAVFDDVLVKSQEYEDIIKNTTEERDALLGLLNNTQNQNFADDFMQGYSDKWLEITSDNTETLYKIRANYEDLLTEAGIAFEELTPKYEIKDGIEVPVGFVFSITSSDEDIENSKESIKAKIEDLQGTYVEEIDKLNKAITTNIESNKSNWTSLSESIFSWLSTDNVYKVFSDDMQTTVQELVNNIDWGSALYNGEAIEEWADIEGYVKDNILSLFDEDNLSQELQSELLNLFTIDRTQISDNDYVALYNDVISKIKAYFTEHNIPIPLHLDFLVADEKEAERQLQNHINKVAYNDFAGQQNVSNYMQEKGIDTVEEKNLFYEQTKDAKNALEIIQLFDEYLASLAKENKFKLFTEENNAAIDAFQEKVSKANEYIQMINDGSLTPDAVINIAQEMGLDVNEIDLLSDSYKGLKEQLEEIANLEFSNMADKLAGLLETGQIDQETYDQLLDAVNLVKLSYEQTYDGMESLSGGMSDLQTSFNSLTDAEREYAKTGKISYETVQALSSAFPELEQELMDYLSGVDDSNTTIIQNLKEAYDADLMNYKAYYAEKHKNDWDFYNQILSNIPENVKARFEEYQADLTNFTSLAEAKLHIEKNLTAEILKQKKAQEAGKPVKNSKRFQDTDIVGTRNTVHDFVTLEDQAKQEAEALGAELDKGVELTITLPGIKYTGSNDNNSDNNKFSEEIDWIARSVENANREVERLNNILENTNGFSAKIKVYEQLAEANQELVDSTKNAADEYKDIWEDSASKIDSKYVDLITSSDSEILQKYEEAVQERKKNYSGSKYAGNVDLYNRPILFDDEGYYETLKSETYNYSDFGINKEGAFNVTPILPDGTKIENLEDYILNQLKKGKSIEDLDVFMGGDYSSINEAVEAAIALHEEQDKIYGTEASYLQSLKEIDGLDLSIETFTNEDTYNGIMTAKEDYDTWKAFEQQYIEALQQQRTDIEAATSLLLEKEELALEILNIADRETMSASKQNKLLEKEKAIKNQILQYNLTLAKTDKEKIKLQKEYDQYLKENAEQQYQNKRNRRSNKVSFYDTEIQDIQNEIGLAEAEGGQGTEQQYLDMNMFLDKQKSLYQKDYNLALEKRNGEKFGTKKWNQYNEEMQEAENGINDCTMAQLENNRAILLLPIHKLEEEKEALEEQLEIYKEKQSKLESAISGASNILQDEIDTYNDLKESITDSYDAQIKAINDKKDALTETNDTLKEQMALEQAQYNLDRALNQKTVKVIRNKQVVYEADARAIIDAQKQLDEEKYNIAVSSFDRQIKSLEDQKEDAIKGIDDQIELLEDYKEKVDSIVGSYEKALELQAFLTLFNTDGNGMQRLLNMDESLYGDMFNQYTDVSSDVTSTEEEIKTIDDTIKEIELIAERWDGAKNTIVTARQQIEDALKNTEVEFQAIKDRNEAAKTINKQWKKVQEKTADSLALIETNQTDSKDAEKPILEERLLNIKTFSEQANGYLSSVSSSIDTLNSKTINPNLSVDLPEVPDVPVVVTVEEENPKKTDDKKNNNKNNKNNKNNNKNNKNNKKEDEEEKKGNKKHSGMENGFIGSRMSNQDDTFQYITLTKLKPDEVPTVLQVGEGVLTKLQQTNVLDNMRTAFYAGIKLPNFNNIQKANNLTPVPSITLNGDIVLQGVNNTTEFAQKIKSEFLTKLSQELYK